ncbi:MAG: glucodextranase DOMON-like domain-containing protein [Gammaproteobacteria bacterium]
MHALRILSLFAGMAFAVWPGSGPAEELFRLDDPRGDDFGAGDLVYPNRPDFERGSLDLEYLEARSTEDGTWFTVRFGRPLPHPRDATQEIGGEPMEYLARDGFYTLNVDIYIDKDRVAGSGNTFTLPGRLVDVHRESAWEQAVILTPRPQVARAWYALHLGRVGEEELRAEKGKVEKGDQASIDAQVEERIDETVYFSERIRVRGREIQFFVPEDFLGGPAREDWAYTVLVTAADAEQAGRVLNISPGGFTLMAMQVAPGIARDRLGIVNQGDVNQPPVMDVLAPSVEAQKRALSDYDVVAPRLASVPGVSPSGRPATPAAAAAAGPAGAQQPGTGPAPSMEAPLPEAGVPAAPGRRTIPSRLKTLNSLKEEGLISEEEYQQLRRKILSEI